ncbi:MAG: hypothetical protein CL846_09440 [Crocinitomicaceae bacterium]|nr:hypothetical protein [Crocinitomicaceae bacterium]|tara:strand:- start:2207 stop:3892 length:1686 start_codon:yes stop_codon:yes gene_type:complete
MEKEEILKNLLAFSTAENELAIKEANHIIDVFNAIYSKEVESYKNSTENDEFETVNPEKDDLNIKILSIIKEFKEAQKEKKEKKEKKEQSNIKIKKEILNRFKNLIDNKEKIAELINGIKKIREDWNNSGDVPRKAYYELQKTYSQLNESFNYNLNIYKELKENDLKRNFSLKNQVIHNLKGLKDEKLINKVDSQLKQFQNEWEEIGPTFKDHWEQIKKDYWEEVHSIQKRIQDHYIKLKESSKENLVAKNQLIEIAAELAKSIPNNHKDFDSKSQLYKNLQDEWKKIGPVSKAQSDKIWNEFRSHFEPFFEAKKEFYNKQKEASKKMAEAKNALIEKAKKIVSEATANSSTQLIKDLQNDWKKIGHAGKFAEQKLWKKFRKECDAFFDKRESSKGARNKEEKENLIAKKAIIEEISKIKEIAFDKLNELISKFSSIGKVAPKEISSLFQRFEKIIDEKISSSKISDEEKHKLQLAVKKSLFSSASDPERAFNDAKHKITKKINEALKETSNLENNLGFFSISKGNNKMLDDFNNKIERQKKQIENWRQDLRKLKQAYSKK